MEIDDDISHLTSDQRRLFVLMSEASEDSFFSGWVYNNEHLLWDRIFKNSRYGMCEIDNEQACAIREAANIAGGWIALDEKPVFLSTDQWTHRHKKFRAKRQ